MLNLLKLMRTVYFLECDIRGTELEKEMSSHLQAERDNDGADIKMEKERKMQIWK